MKYAFIIFTLAIAILGIFKSKKILYKVIIVTILIIAAIFQICIEIKACEEEKKSKYTGKLSHNDFNDSLKVIPLEFGQSGAILGIIYHPPEISLFDLIHGESAKIRKNTNIFKDNSLKIKLIENKINVSAKICDSDGELIVQIENNEWKTRVPPSIFDRNYSDNAFEVKDKYGDIVLQINFTKKHLQFQGIFYDRKGNGYFMIGLASVGAILGGLKNKEKPEYKIKPLFKYPSDLHFGELINN